VTATRLGLEPVERRVLGPEDPKPPAWKNEERHPREYYCLYVNDDEFMLLRIAHPKWHDVFRI
jgi:hypothetical protein